MASEVEGTFADSAPGLDLDFPLLANGESRSSEKVACPGETCCSFGSRDSVTSRPLTRNPETDRPELQDCAAGSCAAPSWGKRTVTSWATAASFASEWATTEFAVPSCEEIDPTAAAVVAWLAACSGIPSYRPTAQYRHYIHGDKGLRLSNNVTVEPCALFSIVFIKENKQLFINGMELFPNDNLFLMQFGMVCAGL